MIRFEVSQWPCKEIVSETIQYSFKCKLDIRTSDDLLKCGDCEGGSCEPSLVSTCDGLVSGLQFKSAKLTVGAAWQLLTSGAVASVS